MTPNALTTAGVTLCLAAAVLVFFEYRDELLFYWLGAVVFVVGSMLDILDGALARAGGKATPFGGFLDSTPTGSARAFDARLDRARSSRGTGTTIALAFAIAAIAGSFLVSYTRAKAELLGLKGDVGIGCRAERVVVITAGLVLAPWGALQWAIYLLDRDRVGHGACSGSSPCAPSSQRCESAERMHCLLTSTPDGSARTHERARPDAAAAQAAAVREVANRRGGRA